MPHKGQIHSEDLVGNSETKSTQSGLVGLVPPEIPTLVVDPSKICACSRLTSLHVRLSPNTQFAAIGRVKAKLHGNKDILLSISVLQEQLLCVTGELGA